jgi:UDP-glucose 4-epimerase
VLPTPEDAEINSEAPYGHAKYSAEGYCDLWRRLHGLSTVSLRFGNVYGPRQDPMGEAGVVAIFCGVLVDGGQPTVFGDGLQTRDYVYVGDVARATIQALGQEGGVFNVGTGRETSVLDLFEQCRRVAGSEVEATFAPARLGELQRSVLDTRLAADELGFGAFVDLEDGLRSTWEWLQKE